VDSQGEILKEALQLRVVNVQPLYQKVRASLNVWRLSGFP
jgi:hypothetical protein